MPLRPGFRAFVEIYSPKDQVCPAGIVVAMSEYENDVVVVGARCAGAATAMLLARLGYRVTMAERAASRATGSPLNHG